MDYYKESLDSVYKELGSSEKGLSSQEVSDRIQKFGYNKIVGKKGPSVFSLFFGQFNDPVVWVLIGALIVSVIVGYYEIQQGHGTFLEHATEPIVIAAIVIVNAVIGFIQEFRTGKAIEALKKLASLKSIVLRDGDEKEIDSTELVPGDIIILSSGAKVPADARLISITNLKIEEAALTGESVPVNKEITQYDKNLQLGDQKNMIFSGTIITEGKGLAMVVRTGMQSEIGKIAKLIDEAEDELTPLQKKLEKLGKFLTYLTLGVCAIVFAVLFLKEVPVLNAFIIAVSLAVAAIPEGLPAVVTISLALGVQRMLKKNALIRRLPSVETLGGTTVICSDKTGTLTKNEMTVRKVFVDNKIVDISGSGYEPKGEFSDKPKDIELLLKIGLLNNDAELSTDEGFKIIGDPTEGSLIVSAEKFGLSHDELEKNSPRVDELLFDSVRKRMTTIHKTGSKKVAFTKGAPDIILSLCDRIIDNGKVRKITQKDKKTVLGTNDKFSSEALRVLGFAYKDLGSKDSKNNYEKNLVFVGLQGMIDPPRLEVKDAINKCKTAGIKVVMITGDYAGTAIAIARELGIEGKAITGEEISKLDLKNVVEDIGIYARVNPEHKMKIVDALQKNGHIVAMTGDGVNDAPALKEADIGISMGITGTDVAKEASDMILTDDNFTSIVGAVEEGRGIFDNIKKFVQYLLSSNLGEVLVIFLATILAAPLGFIGQDGHPLIPLVAVQILWMNLLTDGLPAVALGVDPSSENIMERKPRKTNEGIMTKAFSARIFYTGVLIAAATLFVFWYSLNVRNLSDSHAQTAAFTTLVMLQFVRLYIIRSEYKLGLFSNMKLIGAIALSIILQLVVIYTPLGNFFKTAALTLPDWTFILGVSFVLLLLSMVVNRILPKIGIVGD